MKKIYLISFVFVILVTTALVFFLQNNAKKNTVAPFMAAVAKNQSEVRKCNVSGKIVSGEVAFQNGFGAWTVDSFNGVLESDGFLSYKIIAMYIIPKNGEQLIYETRPNIVKINDQIKKLEEEMKVIEEESDKALAHLKEWGASMEEQVKLKKEAEERLSKMKVLVEKSRALIKLRYE